MPTKTKTRAPIHSLTIDYREGGAMGADYWLNGKLFMCADFVEKLIGHTPLKITVSVSNQRFLKSRVVYILPGDRKWSLCSNGCEPESSAGMYSLMCVKLYRLLGVHSFGTEPCWFRNEDEEIPNPPKRKRAIYVQITEAI